MGRKLTVSDRPTEELCEAIYQIVEEALKLKRVVERKGPDSLDEKFRNKKESRILEILDPRETELGLRQIWNYPVLTEHYDRKQNLIAQCPYVLLGALEIDFMYNENIKWNQQTKLWLVDLLHRYYPEMLEVYPDGVMFFYLPYTVNIKEGMLIPLMGQGPFATRTVASLGQRIVKALSIKGNPLKVYVATENGGGDMPEFGWIHGLKGCIDYKIISVPQAERVIMDFLSGREEKGSTVILTQGAIRGNDLYRKLENKRLTRNGNNLYVVACFNDFNNPYAFNLNNSGENWLKWRMLSDLREDNMLVERLIPFRIDRKI